MSCRYCGCDEKYASFEDGTSSCKKCYIENRYKIDKRIQKGNKKDMKTNLSLEGLLYENSLVQGEMYGGDVDSLDAFSVGLAENGLVRLYDKDGEITFINSDELSLAEIPENSDLITFEFNGFSIKGKCKLTFFKKQFARFNDNKFYYKNISEKIENKKMNDPVDKIEVEENNFNPVFKPLHYNSSNIETRKVIRDITADKPGDEAGLVYNIIKYISRYNKKNGKQDVEKVTFYSLELLSILLDKEGLSKKEISEYIYNLVDNCKPQFAPDRLSVFKD